MDTVTAIVTILLQGAADRAAAPAAYDDPSEAASRRALDGAAANVLRALAVHVAAETKHFPDDDPAEAIDRMAAAASAVCRRTGERLRSLRGARA